MATGSPTSSSPTTPCPTSCSTTAATARSRKSGCWPAWPCPRTGAPSRAWAPTSATYDNDGWPDIVLTALTGETFPLFKNDGGKFFHDATYPSGLGAGTRPDGRMGRGVRRPRQRRLQGSGHGELARQRSDRGVRVDELPSDQRPLPERRRPLRRTSRRSQGRTSRWRAPTGASASAISTATAGSISSSRCSATARSCCATSAPQPQRLADAATGRQDEQPRRHRRAR